MSASDPETVQQDITDYLEQRQNTSYFIKSKQIAEETGLSAKRVGTAMAALQQESTRIKIERWGGDSNGTTWVINLI
jgi:hypothetical protein